MKKAEEDGREELMRMGMRRIGIVVKLGQNHDGYIDLEGSRRASVRTGRPAETASRPPLLGRVVAHVAVGQAFRVVLVNEASHDVGPSTSKRKSASVGQLFRAGPSRRKEA